MPVPATHSTELPGVRTVTVGSAYDTNPVTTLVGRRESPATGRARRCDPAAPPEIIRFHSRGLSGDYYQALSAAAAMRLRLLGTLHARGELAEFSGSGVPQSARVRLAGQQRQAWQQLQWLMAEMYRLDTEGTATDSAV
jgi:hypothetical protein